MHAPASPEKPRLGERYTHNELFDAYPGYWALLAFPDPLTPEEEWDLMNTPGVLIAFDSEREVIWKAHRTFRMQHPDVLVYRFATEVIDDLVVIA